MQKKIVIILMGLGLNWSSLSADVSEMIFYPEADFSEGILHFNYQGDKNKNYGFMFERGFDPERILYVRPAEHVVEKTKDGMTKLTFANTDRYSYLERAFKDDFIVSDMNGIVKILLSGGDCKGSADCVTAENLLTVNVPKGYVVRKYRGLDQDLKELKNPQWQQKGNTYTLIAHNVKGACIMMELEKLKPGQIQTPLAIVNPAAAPVLKAPLQKPLETKIAVLTPPLQKPVESKVAVANPSVEKPIEPKIAPLAEKPIANNLLKPALPVEKRMEPNVLDLDFSSEKPTVTTAVVVSPVEKSVDKQAVPKVSVLTPSVEKPVVQPVVIATVKPISEEVSATPSVPAPYFRNFQLFSNRVVALNDAGKERLSEWAKQFLSGKYSSVTINAYTDNIPPQRLKNLYATNEILSEARGKCVAEYLVSQGIASSVITVVGRGDANPVASNDDDEGRSKNRRVEFTLQR
ncbi:MAG: OmpA family protein [Sulfuricurvum sp.]|nr:OmpA family protein [Sulfuricurvum sp.]